MKSRLAQLNYQLMRSSRQPFQQRLPRRLRSLPSLSPPRKLLRRPRPRPSRPLSMPLRPLKRPFRPSWWLMLPFSPSKRNPLLRPLLPRRDEPRATLTPHPPPQPYRLAAWSCPRPVRAPSTRRLMCLPQPPLRQPATRQLAQAFSVASPSSIATGPRALPAAIPSARLGALRVPPASSLAARAPSILRAPPPAATPEQVLPAHPVLVLVLPRVLVLLLVRAVLAALHVRAVPRHQPARLRARPALHPEAVADAPSSIPRPKKAR
jgi:hypothetical protein